MGICSFSFTGAIIPWLKSSSICSQILEHIIYSNIMNHLSQNNLLSDNHHGFRARRSCETQLITTVQELAKNMSSGKQIDAILLDLSKAFDRVPHRRLLMKLDHLHLTASAIFSPIFLVVVGRFVKQHISKSQPHHWFPKAQYTFLPKRSESNRIHNFGTTLFVVLVTPTVTWRSLMLLLYHKSCYIQILQLSFALPLVGVCCSMYKGPTLSLHIQ
jgi:hypothetical protein